MSNEYTGSKTGRGRGLIIFYQKNRKVVFVELWRQARGDGFGVQMSPGEAKLLPARGRIKAAVGLGRNLACLRPLASSDKGAYFDDSSKSNMLVALK